MARTWAAYILPVVVIAGAIAFCVQNREKPAPLATPAPSARMRVALLDGLSSGDSLETWTVGRIFANRSPTDTPQLAVELEHDGTGITIWIARRDTVKNPPLATEQYALTYCDPRPLGATIPQTVYDAAMAAIAARIRRTERTAPAPQGL